MDQEEILNFVNNSHIDDLEHDTNTHLPLRNKSRCKLCDMDTHHELIPLSRSLEENSREDAEQLESSINVGYHLFQRLEDSEYLSKAIKSSKLFLDIIKIQNPAYKPALQDHIVMLYQKVRHSTDSYVDNLRSLLAKAQQLLEITPLLHPTRFSRWRDVFVIAKQIAEETNGSEDNTKFLKMIRELREAARYVRSIFGSANEELENMPKKKECVKKLVECLTCCSDETTRQNILYNILIIAELEWIQSKKKADLEEYIIICETAIPGAPVEFKTHRVFQLANAYFDRFSFHPTEIEDLNNSIRLFEEVLTITSTTKDPNFQRLCLNCLQMAVARRYECFDRIQDLERVIRIFERSLNQPQDPRQATRIKFHLSRYLIDLFNKTKGKDVEKFKWLDKSIQLLQDLDRSIMNRNSFIIGQAGFPDTMVYAAHLSLAFNNRYLFKHNIEDLNSCLRYSEKFFHPTFSKHKMAPDCLTFLVLSLNARYSRLGNIEDLNLSIRKAEEALELIQAESEARFQIIAALCTSLNRRFVDTGDEESINQALKFGEKLTLCPDSNPKKRTFLNELTTIYFTRYNRYGKLKDIENAIQVQEECLKITPRDYIDWAKYSMTMGKVLFQRWYGNRDLSNPDIDRAISHIQDGIEAAIEQGLDMVPFYYELARIYFSKCELSGVVEDMDLSIDYSRKLINVRGSRSIFAPLGKFHLGLSLYQKYLLVPNPEFVIEAAKTCTETMEIGELPIETRIRSGKLAADSIRLLKKPDDLAKAEEKMIRLLPLVAPRSLRQRDQEYRLKRYARYCTRAVASAFAAGREVSHGLELLEFGRDIIHGLRFENRMDISQLESKHPDLAKIFTDARDGLESQNVSPNIPKNDASDHKEADPWTSMSLSPDVSEKHELMVTFDNVLKEIRSKPGFDRFLQPPHAEDLKSVTSSPMKAVVVINVSSRCDAIILQNGTIQHLPLPQLKQKDVDMHVSNMRSIRWNRGGDQETESRTLSRILIWLWTTTVRPILDDLKFTSTPTDNIWPRVWWVPTGALTQLPLHAAGYHSPDHQGESALDRVVSSYSSSIKALMYTRRHQRNKDPKDPMNKIILVSMLKTEGAGDLKYADQEVNELEKLLSPTGAHTVKVTEPSKSELMEHLRSSSIFHFAGHGTSHPQDPSASCLLLKDWKKHPFTVEDLISMNLYEQSPWLAYLSACSTGQSQSGELYDEAIHLMSACHSAGFQHVVGSLWEVSDWHSLETARIVYGELKDGLGTTGDVALALHTAIRHLRDYTALHGGYRNVVEYVEEVYGDQSDEEQSDHESDDEGISSRGDRAVKSVRIVSKTLIKSEPLIWAAYIHVGL